MPVSDELLLAFDPDDFGFEDPAVAANPTGISTVAWRQDVTGAVFYLVLSPFATPLNPPRQANPESSDASLFFFIAAASTGTGTLVAWTTNFSDEDFSPGIMGRLVGLDGTPATPERLLNEEPGGFQVSPSIAVGPAETYLVVWVGEIGPFGETGLVARHFDAGLEPLSSDIILQSIPSPGLVFDPSVAFNSDGQFLVVWQSGIGDSQVSARLFDIGGTPLTAELRLDEELGRFNRNIAVAFSGTAFVATWESEGISGSEVRARVLSSDGAPLGSEFPVAAFESGLQRLPVLAAEPGGDVVIAWDGAFPDDPSDIGIVARALDDDGSLLDPEILVNSTTEGGQARPGIASIGPGTWLVAWQAPSGNETAIFYRVISSDPDSFITLPEIPAVSTLGAIILSLLLLSVGFGILAGRRLL